MTATMRIQLSQGLWATVDAEDFDWLSQHRWSASEKNKSKGNFYAIRQDRSGERPRMLPMHRAIMGAKAGLVVDHINGDGLDNRRANLRICTQRQNLGNVRRHCDKIGKYKGAYWRRTDNKWSANVGGKYIGLFRCETAAAIAYDVAAKKMFGEYAKLNFERAS